MTKISQGAGGGGPSNPTIVKDSARSQDTIEFILGVCEGPVAGLVDGPKSFYVGDTPLQSVAGDNNFEGFEIHTYLGSATPSRVVTALGGTASNQQVGVELAQFVPVVRTTPAVMRGKINRLEVRMVFNQLLQTNSNGDQLKALAEFRILWRKTKGTDTAWKGFMDSSDGITSTLTTTVTTTSGRYSDYYHTNHYVKDIPQKGNLPEKDDTSASFTLNGALSDNSLSGYNQSVTTAYGKMYFNSSNGDYQFVTNETAIAGMTSETATVTVNFTGGGYDTYRVSNIEAKIDITVRKAGYLSVYEKAGSAYVKEYVRRVPADGYTGDYEIKVERLTTETDENLFVNMVWESFQCVTTDPGHQYENLVVVRGLGNASNQFASLPQFTGVWAGKLIKIPTNYNPITRVYTGVWDGTFKLGYSDNPSWCLYDILMDENYGARKHYPNLKADRFSFYEAAQWCDVLVPRIDAAGYQPRFTYHDLIDQPREGLGACQYIASTFGAIITTDLNGTVRLKLDKPGVPVQIFGPESITPEGFQYQFADITSRANDFTVTFINPELNWAQDVRQVKVDDFINANGRIPMDFVAVGCIDAFEAQRRAYARLLAANTEVTTVTFTTTRPGILLEPYDIIGIVDPYQNWGLSGRVKSIAGNVITLRDPLFLTPNETYTLVLQGKSGPTSSDVTDAKRIIVRNTGSSYSTQLTVTSGTLPSLPANAQFALISNTVGLVKPFRILTIAEDDQKPDMFTISAIEVNVNKYTDADNMTLSPSKPYSFENSMVPAKPTKLTAESGTQHLYIRGDGQVASRIYLTWEQDPTSFATEFEVFYRRMGVDNFQKINATGLDCYIDDVKDGATYQIYIRAVNALNRRSPDTAILQHTVVGKLAPPSTPTNLVILQDGPDVRLDWVKIVDLDLAYYEIREGGSNWDTATKIGTSRADLFVHTNVKKGNLVYRIKAVDTSGNYSTGTLTGTFAVAPPQSFTIKVALAGPNYVVSIQPNLTDEVPIKHYIIELNGNEVFRGAATSFTGRVNWTGNVARTFTVTAVNTADVPSTPVTATLAITKPGSVAVTGRFANTFAVLSWSTPTGSLPVDHYCVLDYTANQLLDDDLRSTTYKVPVEWLGNKTFQVWAVDTAGNIGEKSSVVLKCVAPGVENLQSTLKMSTQRFTWTGVDGTLPIKQYHIYQGEVFADASLMMFGIPAEFGGSSETQRIATVTAETWSTPVDWNGTRWFYIVPEDVRGNLGLPVQVVEKIDPPPAPAVTYSIVDKSIRFDWADVISELRVKEYQIYRDGVLLHRVSASAASIPINFSGTKTYQIRAVDEAGNLGAFSNCTVSIAPPSAFSFNYTFSGEQVKLNWSTPTSTLPISHYILERDVDEIAKINSTSFSTKASWLGTETFKVTAYDVAGNASPTMSLTVTINAPGAPVVRSEVIDNNVLLRWTNTPGTIPLVGTEIRRGSTFATAEVLQQMDATFATFFEYNSGVYTYWLVGIDSAGNYGTPVSKNVRVAEPPDYVLHTNYNSLLNGTRTLVTLEDDALYFGVDDTQTFEQHFTSDGFTSPQDQISAGFPWFLQPTSLSTSKYVEAYDYGTILSASTINITPTYQVLAGNPTLACDIEYRATTSNSWTKVTDVFQVYTMNFRYVRFTLRLVSDTRDDLIKVTGINLRINTKLKNDAGSANGAAADPTGTWVSFNVPFVDVASLNVQPKSTTPIIAVYDFNDIPNPTGFAVYLFDKNGNRVSAPFSWTARGY